jgi:hypothetical protein
MFVFLLGAVACSKPSATAEAHRQMVTIESAMIEQYNTCQTALEQGGAIKLAVDKITEIDVSQCPVDYQRMWDELIDLWQQWQLALEKGNTNQAVTLSTQSPAKADALFKIARREGYEPAGK